MEEKIYYLFTDGNNNWSVVFDGSTLTDAEKELAVKLLASQYPVGDGILRRAADGHFYLEPIPVPWSDDIENYRKLFLSGALPKEFFDGQLKLGKITQAEYDYIVGVTSRYYVENWNVYKATLVGKEEVIELIGLETKSVFDEDASTVHMSWQKFDIPSETYGVDKSNTTPFDYNGKKYQPVNGVYVLDKELP